MVTRIRWESPSLTPMVTMASVSGSISTSKRRRYQSEMARRSRVIPMEAE
jgi:hypothetical protein